jgi:hypothetical protein
MHHSQSQRKAPRRRVDSDDSDDDFTVDDPHDQHDSFDDGPVESEDLEEQEKDDDDEQGSPPSADVVGDSALVDAEAIKLYYGCFSLIDREQTLEIAEGMCLSVADLEHLFYHVFNHRWPGFLFAYYSKASWSS